MKTRFLALLTVLAACSGKPSIVDPPQPLNYVDAGTGDCREPGETASPLVVDIHPTDRQGFEVALNDASGIVAVQLTCKEGLKLLPECKAPGNYGFKGATLKEQVVQFETADELKANLPLGVSFAKLSAELSRGATLDVALAMIGKLRASRPLVGKEDLQGDCGGATHFIRGATIGAFAMKQGTRGKLGAAATLFAEVSKSTGSTKTVAQHDGTREACKAGGPKSTEAPEDCGAVLRLELRALVAGKADPMQAAPPIEVEGCPDGMIFDAGKGKCREAKPGEGTQCKYGDQQDCRAQCHAGHPGSCAFYASGLMEADKLAEAAPYFEKGCNAGIPLACHNLGFAIWSGAGVPKDDARAMKLFIQVCEGGTAVGCAGIALMHYEGSGVPKDLAKAAQFYDMACKAGDQEYGCPLLGRMIQNGEGGLTRDVEKARALYKTACDAGSRNGCLLLQQM
ncbi:MAG TPA: tetratricopeptide repeat protein [Kofleriaceae bacterium]|nr:tetratricopeptide repeat protein [Kofleriaceae bacterium]